MIMACKYKSKLCFSGWCDVACMYCTFTQERNCEHNKKTNADRIRAMSDEELAEQFVFMSTICEFCVKRKNCEEVPGYKYCMEGILDWLQQPAEEDDKNGV